MLSRFLALAVSTPLFFAAIAQAGVDSVLNTNPGAIGPGQTQTPPDVDSICKALRNAENATFTNEKGEELKAIDPECASKYTFRADQRLNCTFSLSTIVANAKAADPKADIDTLCNGNTTGKLAVYCTLRAMASANQTVKYCDAYDSANRAQTQLEILLALDGASAGVCWVEYLALKAKQNASPETIVKAGNSSGPCSDASVAAGTAELVSTALLIGKNQTRTGDFSVRSAEKPQDKTDGFKTAKLLDMLGSAGLSLGLIRNGLCQNNAGREKVLNSALGVEKANWLCGGSKDTRNAYKDARDRSARASDDLSEAIEDQKRAEAALDAAQQDCALQAQSRNRNSRRTQVVESSQTCLNNRVVQARSDLNQAKIRVSTAHAMSKHAKNGLNDAKEAGTQALQSRIDLTRTSAEMLTALAAMRGAAIKISADTKKHAGEALESMFAANTGGTAMGSAALSAISSIYTGGPNSTFTSPTTSGNLSAATAGAPEGFLIPPQSALGHAAQTLASQMPKGLKDAAAQGSASGVSGLISAAAQAAGAPPSATNEIQRSVGTYFANMPKGEDGYGGGGGGKLASSGGDKSGGDLNLKGLFGQNGGEEQAAGPAPEVAYRGPASEEDIWHSQNPKGNNLFQIVSEKYGTMQRKSGIGPGL